MVTSRTDLYDALTSQLITALEAGTPPWRKPWTAAGGFLPLRHEGTAYRGVNILLLWTQADASGYAPGPAPTKSFSTNAFPQGEGSSLRFRVRPGRGLRS